MKKELYNTLLTELSKCEKCTNLKNRNEKDCALINLYKNEEFCKNIPSIWTDWFNRLNSKIMIMGQDWGPYSDMEIM